jgi:hypothetical protein
VSVFGFASVGEVLIGQGMWMLAFAALMRFGQRLFGSIAGCCGLGIAGSYGALLYATGCLWTAPFSLVMFGPGAAGLSVFGLLLSAQRKAAFASCMPSFFVTFAALGMALAGPVWLTDLENAHRARLQLFASRMSSVAPHSNEPPRGHLRLQPPPGARTYVGAWKAAEKDERARARLLSEALGLRTVPCLPIHAPLKAWRAQDARTFAQLAELLHDGLLACPFAGVDVDALEYIVLLPFAG